MLEFPGLKNEGKKSHPSLLSSPCCNTGEIQGVGRVRITPTFKCIFCPREKQTRIGEKNFLLETEATLKAQLASVLKTRWILMVIKELNLYHLAAKPRGEEKISSKGLKRAPHSP